MSFPKPLVERARFLRNAAPREFEEFHAAFQAYTETAAKDLVMTTGDLQLAQGIARQCLNILHLLEEVRNG